MAARLKLSASVVLGYRDHGDRRRYHVKHASRIGAEPDATCPEEIPGTRLGRDAYLTRLMIWNIGMYSAMTAAPTHAPMKAIRMGSISEVSASTEASTSWS